MTESHVRLSPFDQDVLLHGDETRVRCNANVAVGSGYEMCTSGKPQFRKIAKKGPLASSCVCLPA